MGKWSVFRIRQKLFFQTVEKDAFSPRLLLHSYYVVEHLPNPQPQIQCVQYVGYTMIFAFLICPCCHKFSLATTSFFFAFSTRTRTRNPKPETRNPNRLPAVSQPYETRVGDEFVVLGNDVLMKCDFPGFASDLLRVVAWRTEPDGTEVTAAYSAAAGAGAAGAAAAAAVDQGPRNDDVWFPES